MQVLLGYSDDPRELSEIRVSETRYRALADSLRSKLDGPEFQARQDALRQRKVLPRSLAHDIRTICDRPRPCSIPPSAASAVSKTSACSYC